MKKYDERESVDKIQEAVSDIKGELQKIIKHNKSEGRAEEANAAFKMKNKLGVWHAEATEEMFKFWPEALVSDIVIRPRGGGGR